MKTALLIFGKRLLCIAALLVAPLYFSMAQTSNSRPLQAMQGRYGMGGYQSCEAG
ncbi:hypothetical protein [Pontibacter indicus]|uniref:hypothetical protein n=1 Tax=Pontibacter indicus TaxID=1317125 RepID=UPI00147B128A|nr:hypothetical protein [Pontibacter indicus]